LQATVGPVAGTRVTAKGNPVGKVPINTTDLALEAKLVVEVLKRAAEQTPIEFKN